MGTQLVRLLLTLLAVMPVSVANIFKRCDAGSVARPYVYPVMENLFWAILPETASFAGAINITMCPNPSKSSVILYEEWSTNANYETYIAWRAETGFQRYATNSDFTYSCGELLSWPSEDTLAAMNCTLITPLLSGDYPIAQLEGHSCQVGASELTYQIEEENPYSWCDIENDLTRLRDWFDDSVMYAWAIIGRASHRHRDSIAWATNTIFTTQRIVFAVISIIANAGVLFYHFTTPPHPKFLVLTWFLRAIRIHIFAGSIEVVAPLISFFTTSIEAGRAAIWVTLCAEVFHSSTALYMTPSVFGTRFVIIPAYYTCIFVKLMLAIGLFFSMLFVPNGEYKDQVEWLWTLWCAHNTYAWVRVWFTFFDKTETIISHRYTMSVVLAGAVCCGQAIGFWFVVFYFLAVGINAYYQRHLAAMLEACADPKAAAILALHCAEAYVEASRLTTCQSPQLLEKAIVLMQQQGILDADGKLPLDFRERKIPTEVQSNIIFGLIDEDNSGQISVKELSKFLIHFGVDQEARVAMITQYRTKSGDTDNVISKAEFFKWFRPFWKYLFPEMLPQFIRDSRTRNRFISLAEHVTEEAYETEVLTHKKHHIDIETLPEDGDDIETILQDGKARRLQQHEKKGHIHRHMRREGADMPSTSQCPFMMALAEDDSKLVDQFRNTMHKLKDSILPSNHSSFEIELNKIHSRDGCAQDASGAPGRSGGSQNEAQNAELTKKIDADGGINMSRAEFIATGLGSAKDVDNESGFMSRAEFIAGGGSAADFDKYVLERGGALDQDRLETIALAKQRAASKGDEVLPGDGSAQAMQDQFSQRADKRRAARESRPEHTGNNQTPAKGGEGTVVLL